MSAVVNATSSRATAASRSTIGRTPGNRRGRSLVKRQRTNGVLGPEWWTAAKGALETLVIHQSVSSNREPLRVGLPAHDWHGCAPRWG